MTLVGCCLAETEDGGVWDSIHVLDVQNNGKRAIYKLTTTIMLALNRCARAPPTVQACTSARRLTYLLTCL